MCHNGRVFACAVLLFGMGTGALAQTTYATITGTVTDPAGALIPNATVTATNLETNIKTTATSNEAGNYTIAQLKEGAYTVRVESAGFKSFVAADVMLVARDVRVSMPGSRSAALKQPWR